MEFFDSRFGKLRVVEKDGKKWFIACDVIKALGVSNPYLILAKVHRDDKTYVYVDVASGTPRLIGLNETGLGKFLYHVHKDERDAYVKWLRDEVLSCVRNATLPAVRADTVPDRVETSPVFHNDEFGDLRTIIIDGNYWFVGKDVAACLGYSNASKAVMNHVDDEDKQFVMLPVTDSQTGNLVKTAIINEAGIYSLILRKPD